MRVGPVMQPCDAARRCAAVMCRTRGFDATSPVDARSTTARIIARATGAAQ
jgi:hypothetical protein